MNHGSLFSGIGGFDLAAEWMGWNNVFHCEWNDFGKKVLNYYWPEAISYDDITKTDFTIHRGNIDILTGGFPCQGFSMAGKRKGTEDERYLWPEMLRAIREIKPVAVVGENVTGILSMGQREMYAKVESRQRVRYHNIDHYEAIYTRQIEMLVPNIIKDLEEEGYKVQILVLPAAGVGAPHRRDRVWFVAYNTDTGAKGVQRKGRNSIYGSGTTPDTNNTGTGKPSRNNSNGQEKDEGRQGQPQPESWQDSRATPDPGNQGLQGGAYNGSAGSGRTQRNKQFAGCVRPGWDNFPTQSPVCGGDDGFSNRLDGITFPKWRNESIKAYGNAIVPQVAYQIFKTINQYEI